jgi:hypothetical protein
MSEKTFWTVLVLVWVACGIVAAFMGHYDAAAYCMAWACYGRIAQIPTEEQGR